MSYVVSDAAVQAIVNQSMMQNRPRAGESVIHQVGRTFKSLQLRRQTLEPLNIDLAAAEHYMYARFLSGVSGDPSVKMAPTLYGLKKRLYFALGIQDRMAVTKLPVLPPNQDVERWGKKGAEVGLADYSATAGKPAVNYGAAVSALLTEAKRYN